MTVIELLWFSLVVLIGYCLGKLLSYHFGIAGWFVGFPFGCLVGIFALRIIGTLIDPWNKGEPNLPVCRSGKCHFENYEFIKDTKEGIVFRCACGVKYLFTGQRFMELLDDGTTRPFMKRSGIRPWGEDK